MKRQHRQYVRQMPKIYGDLQPKRRPLAAVFKWLRTCLWGAVVGSFIYAVWLSGWFSLRKVEVEGTLFSSADSIRNQIPLGTNMWFVSKDELAARITQDPIVRSVAIYRGIPDSLKIVVEERKPAVLWTSGGTVSVLDEEGVSYLQYPQAQVPTPDTPVGLELATLPRITDTTSLPVGLGQQVVSPIFIRFVRTNQAQMQELLPQVGIANFEVADTTYDLTLVAQQGMRVRFNTLGDPAVQVRNLNRLVSQGKASLTSQVDLRIDRWAYVL